MEPCNCEQSLSLEAIMELTEAVLNGPTPSLVNALRERIKRHKEEFNEVP